MLEPFLTFIAEKKLWQPQDKILVAVSGGIDSVVMADLFASAKYDFGIVHCNFQLRGKDSVEDAKFVEAIATKYNVPFFIKEFSTSAVAKTEKISIQMAARHLRYDWFDHLLKEEGYRYLTTGHHLNDEIETVLFNLVKGTGIAGLHGIPLKANNVVRPMLFAGRQMIETYALEHQLIWREDSSNSSVKYHRNLIRHQVMPLLEKINPNLSQTTATTLERIRGAEKVFDEAIRKEREALTFVRARIFYIHIEKLLASVHPEIILYEIIKAFQFNYSQCKNVIRILKNESATAVGKTFLSAAHQLTVDRLYLMISEGMANTPEQIDILPDQRHCKIGEKKLMFSKIPIENFSLNNASDIAQLDYEKLRFPLQLRPWKKGDAFMPLGMRHKKKISDFLIDLKVPLPQKEQVLVLTSHDEIIWVVGFRIDNRFKISPKTKIVYCINYLYPNV